MTTKPQSQHTPGPVTFRSDEYGTITGIETIHGHRSICTFNWKAEQASQNKELLPNAELIRDAFNVATETGKTPRQLAEENKELVAALKMTVGCLELRNKTMPTKTSTEAIALASAILQKAGAK